MDRQSYWTILGEILKTKSKNAPTEADRLMTLSLAYRCLALGATAKIPIQNSDGR
jgi:hypothetical protein